MSDAHPPRPYRGPYETCIMFFLLLASIGTLLPHAGPPRSIDLLLNGFSLWAWSGMFLIGSMLTLLGMSWRGRYITALGIERVGLILHSAGCAIYVIALTTNPSAVKGTFFASAFVASIIVANIWRYFQILRTIRRIIAVADHMPEKEGE